MRRERYSHPNRFNKRRFWAFLVVLWLVIIYFALIRNQSDVRQGKSLLWEISRADLKKPSYLFGTVHLMDSSQFELPELLRRSLLFSDQVVFEINTDLPEYQSKSLALAMMKNDSLDHLLPQKEYDSLERFFKDEFHFPLKAIKKMKPFYIASVINALSLPKTAKSYETELNNMAKENGKEITGITTIEEETKVLEHISMEAQLYEMSQAVIEYLNEFKRRNQIIELYREQNIDQIHGMMTEDTTAEAALIYRYMFPERHEIWIPKIVRLMENQSCFFAVGVGHLPGKDGLIEQLRAMGYHVRPINMKFRNDN